METPSEVGTDVGTIVWVRRRNGSWWPGRILGEDELSASHLVSPRSGTPVKLLGREDASVDWYNMEKSKRVKAFRCGEFDACIEHAEASRGIPIKKREKYARREDAIIHALELEKQMLEESHQGLGQSFSNKQTTSLRKERSTCFRTEGDVLTEDTMGKPISYRKVELPLSVENKSKTFVEKWKVDMPLSPEDVNSNVPLRKRRLLDTNVPAIPLKRKLPASGSYECSKRTLLMDNHAHSLHDPLHGIDGWNSDGCNKNDSPVGKRSEIWLREDSVTKREHKHRPHVENMRHNAEFVASDSTLSYGRSSGSFKRWTACMESHDCLDKENTSSGLIEPDESDSSARHRLDSETEPDETLVSSISKTRVPKSVDSGRKYEYDQTFHFQGCARILNNDTSLTSDRRTIESAMAGICRWKLKKKRSIRKTLVRGVNRMGVRNSGTFENESGSYDVSKGCSETDASKDSDLINRDLDAFCPTNNISYWRMLNGSSMDSSGHSLYDSDRESSGRSLSGWDAERRLHASQKRLGDGSQQFGQFYSGQFSGRQRSKLVDVELKVQANYKGEHVPLVSLTSKLNGKAIIGHPIQVEALSYGFTDTLLPEKLDDENPSCSYGVAAPPVWRTAKRTTLSRVPRYLAVTPLVEDKMGISHVSNQENMVPFKRPLAVHFAKNTIFKKSVSRSHRLAKKKHQKKSLKKTSLASSAKGQRNSSSQSNRGRKPYNGNTLSKLIKPEDTLSLVTCVPVKAVFSRILESVGRSSSNASFHRNPKPESSLIAARSIALGTAGCGA